MDNTAEVNCAHFELCFWLILREEGGLSSQVGQTGNTQTTAVQNTVSVIKLPNLSVTSFCCHSSDRNVCLLQALTADWHLSCAVYNKLE